MAISNFLIVREVDVMAAVAKAQKAAVSMTRDLYSIKVREADSADLLTGVLSSTTVDNNLNNGTQLHHQFTPEITELTNRAISAGSDSLADLFRDRNQRWSASFNDLIWYSIGGANQTAIYVFPDTDVSFGTFLYGGSFVAGSNLASTIGGCWGVIVVGTGGIDAGQDWTLTVSVTYADGTTGDETVVCSASAPATTVYDIGGQALDDFCLSGQSVIPLGATTGFAQDQYVLIVDTSCPLELTADAASAQADIVVGNDNCSVYEPGMEVTVRDSGNTEDLVIESIDYETGTITMTTNLSNSYTTAAGAVMYMKAAAIAVAEGSGWQELLSVASVSSGVSITATETLYFPYTTNAKVIRLISDVTNIATSTGGASGDDVIARSYSERAISQ